MAATPRRPRIAALDAARALAVLAMVFGHTLDAVLAKPFWESPGFAQYWKARGLTAPLFMIISGWAVTLAISRSGATGWDVPRARWRRVALLLFIGYLLHWPGWALERLLAGDREIWAGFLAFDALHVIGLSLGAASLVLALPWARWRQGVAFLWLLALCVVLGRSAPLPDYVQVASLPDLPWLAVVQVVGGSSRFPVVPWAGYFFAGAAVGLLIPQDRRGALLEAGLGAALVAATAPFGVGDRFPGDPLLIAFRIGAVLLVLAALSVVPERVARLAAPLGKASLGVYALHLPLVYGWSVFPGLWQRVGPTLGAGAAFATAVGVLLASFALLWLGKALWRWARGLWPKAGAGPVASADS
ncbi:MAG: heparan-alpha-glucosaminide N-acetyltransferase domain-containing protein [Anaeromyxobacter sp.]